MNIFLIYLFLMLIFINTWQNIYLSYNVLHYVNVVLDGFFEYIYGNKKRDDTNISNSEGFHPKMIWGSKCQPKDYNFKSSTMKKLKLTLELVLIVFGIILVLLQIYQAI